MPARSCRPGKIALAAGRRQSSAPRAAL